jgi:DNA-binding transcriptional MerR regulator/methylmalonyl-CoA mutase cobalamin-binding subunit
LFAIGTVERDTGIGRDTLRIWERRYGFPTPERNDKGERVYSSEQIRRLQQIRRLLDQGLRPGKVVPLNEEALGKLAGTLPEASASLQDIAPAQAELIALASAGDISALTAALEQDLTRYGLRSFVLDTFAPLTTAVGELWAGGRLQVFEEHLLTRHLVHFLDVAMSRVGRPPGDPQVLLATLPGERHSLGLLMAEALLIHAGRATLNLGTDVPLDQIVAAAERSEVKTVALSFSACYARGSLRGDIEELADRLPRSVEVWIGGAGVKRLRRLPPSVMRKSLDSL